MSLPARHFLPPQLSLRFVPVWRRNFLVWRKLTIPSILGNLADPLLYMLGFGYGIGALVPQMQGMSYIAFIAAGFLSPFATIVIVLLTWLGAVPVYNRIAALSPHGQGSLSVLEERLPRWRGRSTSLVERRRHQAGDRRVCREGHDRGLARLCAAGGTDRHV